MNKSTLLVLALAMLVPTVALADGVTIGGDVRLRWDYTGSDSASANGTSAVTNIDLDAAINDNVSFAVSLRNGIAFGDGGGGLLGLQQAYASIGDLGSASGVLAGWSLDVGRMNNPDYGRIINSDDWAQDTAPASSDGYTSPRTWVASPSTSTTSPVLLVDPQVVLTVPSVPTSTSVP